MGAEVYLVIEGDEDTKGEDACGACERGGIKGVIESVACAEEEGEVGEATDPFACSVVMLYRPWWRESCRIGGCDWFWSKREGMQGSCAECSEDGCRGKRLLCRIEETAPVEENMRPYHDLLEMARSENIGRG